MSDRKSSIPWVASMVMLALMLAYVWAYYAAVLKVSLTTEDHHGRRTRIRKPYYQRPISFSTTSQDVAWNDASATVFTPIHWIDRHLIRRRLWR